MSWTDFVQWVTAIKPILDALAVCATLIAASWGLDTYHRSVRLERAKWMKELYEKFYEDNRLKSIRDLLDGDDDEEITRLVQNGDPSFTDYLNFFEFLSFLHESKQIRKEEVQGLFDYYLRSLTRNAEVRRYIDDPSNGFEKLKRLLKQLK